MKVTQVNVGDIILEGKREILVKTKEINACSKPSVHLNDMCYDIAAQVLVRTAAEVEESGLGDLEEDVDLEWDLDRLDALADEIIRA